MKHKLNKIIHLELAIDSSELIMLNKGGLQRIEIVKEGNECQSTEELNPVCDLQQIASCDKLIITVQCTDMARYKFTGQQGTDYIKKQDMATQDFSEGTSFSDLRRD